MNRAALKLVTRPSFHEEYDSLWEDEGAESRQSLHYVQSLPWGASPEFAAFAVQRFSRRGQIVLDPFCGAGAVALEACLQGRLAYVSDWNAWAARITRAKLAPVDISAVTLKLQLLNLQRPVAVEQYRRGFNHFYALETYRELVGLRAALLQADDKISRFVQLLASSLLHGHSAGYFSVYSLPQFSVTPEEQALMNEKRGQVPDHRAVVPRILRRCAMVLNDGIPSVLAQAHKTVQLDLTDPRNLSTVRSGSVDTLISAPPGPWGSGTAHRFWLKLWFEGLDPAQLEESCPIPAEKSEWIEFMNEALLEAARVVKVGGRAVLCLKPTLQDGGLAGELRNLVESALGRYWEAEAVLHHESALPKLAVGARPASSGSGRRADVLVLRRR